MKVISILAASCVALMLRDYELPTLYDISGNETNSEQVSSYAKQQGFGLQLLGYYHANANLADKDLGATARKISDKIAHRQPAACSLLVIRFIGMAASASMPIHLAVCPEPALYASDKRDVPLPC